VKEQRERERERERDSEGGETRKRRRIGREREMRVADLLATNNRLRLWLPSQKMKKY
jgi:hypothetical protein